MEAIFNLLLLLFTLFLILINLDHAHLLFQYHPEIQLSKLVNSLKSVSSRKLRQEFLPELEKTYYKKKVVWNSSYFLSSCGGVTISTLKKYIENQDKPIK